MAGLDIRDFGFLGYFRSIISQPFENSSLGETAFRWRIITGHWPTPSRWKIGAPFAKDGAKNKPRKRALQAGESG
jgi:hypothetical protein